MSDERHYLELSEDEGSHKFYEAIVSGKKLTLRYGRIGDSGQKQEKTFPTAEAARAEAAKKVGEKTRKGYAPAVMGEREKRAVSRRSVASSPSRAKPAPVLWKFETKQTAFGIFIDDERCWVGNQAGRVFALGHDGKPRMQFKLPKGVECLVGDHDWLYAGCDDGNVYDLTGKVPRLAYSIAEDVDILWLDICGGVLAVSDDEGRVSVFDAEEERLWAKKSKGDSGWMVRATQETVFHGHSGGVTAYGLLDGKQKWDQKAADVLFGWQTDAAVYPGCGSGKVLRLAKKDGKVGLTCKTGDSVLSNAASPDDEYVFAGTSDSTVFCFDRKGEQLWSLGTGCGSALSMQYHLGKLYLVTTEGTLACLDASEAAIVAAQAGSLPKTKQVQAPKAVAQVDSRRLETARDAKGGVEVECVKEGGKLRVRVASKGYKKGWNVQFPRNLRQEGTRYVVDEVREAAQGGFYRAYGNIRKLSL
ncbi:MAG: WGR domain-containing protein [Gemmataceae bacterium]|nr:WGR domain-containing protein [Gemmataceae bacterium]